MISPFSNKLFNTITTPGTALPENGSLGSGQGLNAVETGGAARYAEDFKDTGTQAWNTKDAVFRYYISRRG